jgi:uncharacterized protein
MPYFILTCVDKAGALDLRVSTRPEHLSYLAGFKENVKLAGPLLDRVEGNMIGSHFILSFETQAEAQSFADGDPYALAGVFDQSTLRPYRITIGTI